MKRYFITGTDTDCGKTYVTTKLVNYFAAAAAIKPVASGCMEIEGQMLSDDALQIQKVTNLSMEVINPWRFKLPVSPHLAAREKGVELSASAIADYCLNLQLEGVEQLFIEGAGGLMVPLNDHETWIDFLRLTKFPVILVVGIKLGCINHALLSAAALDSQGIECVGWIASCIDPDVLALSAIILTLQTKIKSPLLTVLPHAGNISQITI